VFIFVLMLTLGSIIQFALPESSDNRNVKFVVRSVLEQVLALVCMILYCFDSLAAATSMQRVSPSMYNTKYDTNEGSIDPGIRASTAAAGGNAGAQRSPTATVVQVGGSGDSAATRVPVPTRALPPVTRRRSRADASSAVSHPPAPIH
jgi:hypothetical protein